MAGDEPGHGVSAHGAAHVCGFIHDEMLVLIPDGTDYDSTVSQVQRIRADGMREVTPDIPIQTCR